MLATRDLEAPARVGWPGACEVCRGWCDRTVCGPCIDEHMPIRLRCRRCALPLAGGGDTCGRCIADRPPFERTWCAVDYVYPWDSLIRRFKFDRHVELAAPLADLLLDPMTRKVAGDDAVAPDLMVPVPLSEARLRERGYDQAWLLARHLARRLRVAARPRVLTRRFDHAHQVSLSRAQRLANLRGAFHVPPAERRLVAGAHMGLVDDVMTTGATAQHAAQALLDAGARRVDLWVLARTPEPGADR